MCACGGRILAGTTYSPFPYYCEDCGKWYYKMDGSS